MKYLTIQDRKTMRYMGYTLKVVFKNSKGIPFTKDFRNDEEMAAFITKAEEAGSTVDAVLSL